MASCGPRHQVQYLPDPEPLVRLAFLGIRHRVLDIIFRLGRQTFAGTSHSWRNIRWRLVCVP